MEVSLRLTVANLQTGIATTLGYWNYLTTAHRYLLAHDSVGIAGAIRYLNEEMIDIGVFCEIEGGSRRTREVNQVQVLSESTGLRNNFYVPTFVVGKRVNMGNAICSRFPVLPIANHRLPGAGEPRFVSEAKVETPAGAIGVFMTHLSLERRIRAAQIRHIADLMRGRVGPMVLGGDFNVAEEAELELLSKSRVKQVVSAPTYPSWKPKRTLDHLFFSSHFRVLESHVFNRLRFSDHLPLVALVRMETQSEECDP